MRQIESAERSDTRTAPAADRVVQLDHNSDTYRQTVEALDQLEHTQRGANTFEDVEEKEQRIAEVSAVRRLFEAMRIRVDAVITLLRPLVIQFGTKLKDGLIAAAVGSVITLLGALFGKIGGLF